MSPGFCAWCAAFKTVSAGGVVLGGEVAWLGCFVLCGAVHGYGIIQPMAPSALHLPAGDK